MAEIGVQIEDGEQAGPPPAAVGQFQAWAEAHTAGNGDDALAAYAALVAALDGALDDAALDPVRDAVHAVLAQLGAEAPYAPPPQRPRVGEG